MSLPTNGFDYQASPHIQDHGYEATVGQHILARRPADWQLAPTYLGLGHERYRYTPQKLEHNILRRRLGLENCREAPGDKAVPCCRVRPAVREHATRALESMQDLEHHRNGLQVRLYGRSVPGTKR
jgi:hypothetical protein